MTTKVAGTRGTFAPVLDGSSTPGSGDVAGVAGVFRPILLESAAVPVTVTPDPVVVEIDVVAVLSKVASIVPDPVVVEIDVVAVSASSGAGISIPIVQHHRQRNF